MLIFKDGASVKIKEMQTDIDIIDMISFVLRVKEKLDKHEIFCCTTGQRMIMKMLLVVSDERLELLLQRMHELQQSIIANGSATQVVSQYQQHSMHSSIRWTKKIAGLSLVIDFCRLWRDGSSTASTSAIMASSGAESRSSLTIVPSLPPPPTSPVFMLCIHLSNQVDKRYKHHIGRAFCQQNFISTQPDIAFKKVQATYKNHSTDILNDKSPSELQFFCENRNFVNPVDKLLMDSITRNSKSMRDAMQLHASVHRDVLAQTTSTTIVTSRLLTSVGRRESQICLMFRTELSGVSELCYEVVRKLTSNSFTYRVIQTICNHQRPSQNIISRGRR